ncbi:MAG: hypothetical protein WBA97_10230 [Actinophytocola sp.]|uniref:hypothetical protein n=1 Tax=Actinophytocola sp. TaxID=1872138 RepID=UPI003C75C73C
MTEPQQPITNTKTGQANSVGGYANTGVHVGDVNLNTGTPVRTWYREQVRRIVPPELLDREAELEELAKFCTDPATRGRYSWWRAEAWAGKSALMSWFFLNPPPAVRLVSFFITARFASQNDRVSFGDNLIEQLAAILGVPMPQTTDSTRDMHLLGMLHEAGIPAVTPKIMTEWLTEPGLSATAKIHLATAARRLLAERRPADALVASEADEEVLAAVALAACTAGYIDAGALLARHIENPAQRVNAVTALATACVRAGEFDDAETLLSVCGGSEYRAEATMSLALVFAETDAVDRAADLMLQRQFLIEEVMTEDGHTELKSKAAQAWAALGDFEQATRVATSLSGANERAEVFTALAQRVIDRGDFDVARGFATQAETYARMSVTTTTRVQGFTALARAYAAAGNLERAESIAGVAVSPDGEPSAEEHLAMTFVEMGEHERAVRIAHRFSPLVRDHLLVELVTAVDSGHDLAWAVELARSVSTDPARMRALAHCARLAAGCGDLDQAIAITLAIPDTTIRTEVSCFLVRKLARARDMPRLRTLTEWATDRLDLDPAPDERRSATHLLAAALAAQGEFTAATQVMTSLPEDGRDAVAVTAVAVAALTGAEDRARGLLELIGSPAARQSALDELVSAAIACRDLVRANELVDDLDDIDLRDRVRAEIAAAAAEAGKPALAGEVLGRIRAAEHRGWALAAVTAAGFVLPLPNDAESVVQRVTDPDARIDLLAVFVEVMASVGRAEQAAELIRATSEPEHRGLAWAVLAENLAGDAARNAVALSFRWGRWTTALGRLARLEADSLPGVEAEFFVLNPESAVG